jgi:hypothetical protein
MLAFIRERRGVKNELGLAKTGICLFERLALPLQRTARIAYEAQRLSVKLVNECMPAGS